MPRRFSLSLFPLLIALALACSGARLCAQTAAGVQDTTRGKSRGQAGGQTTQPSAGADGPSIGVRVRIPSQVTVPDLTGMSRTMARIRLVTGNLIPGGVDSTDAPGARPGRIVSQEPAPGTVVRPGTRVRMTVATHAPAPVATPVTPPPPSRPAVELVAVPSLAGRTVADAREALGGARLLLGGVDSASAPAAAVGTVVRQRPAAGDSVQPGTPVTIVVARQQLVTVPSVAGMTLADARRTLAAAGLRPGAVTTTEAPGRPLVVGQSVPAGTAVIPNTVVALTLSQAPVVAPIPAPPAAQPPAAPAQPADAAPAATQPATPAANPVAQPVDSVVTPEPANPPVPAPSRVAPQPAARQPVSRPRAVSFPREAVWALLGLLLVAVAGVTYLRLRRRVATRTTAVAAPVAPTPPVAVRMRVSAGDSRTTAGPEHVGGGGRVRLGVRIADPRPVERNAEQTPLGAGRVAVRAVQGRAPELAERPETIGGANRMRVQVRGAAPVFRAVDGGPVILKRR